MGQTDQNRTTLAALQRTTWDSHTVRKLAHHVSHSVRFAIQQRNTHPARVMCDVRRLHPLRRDPESRMGRVRSRSSRCLNRNPLPLLIGVSSSWQERTYSDAQSNCSALYCQQMYVGVLSHEVTDSSSCRYAKNDISKSLHATNHTSGA